MIKTSLVNVVNHQTTIHTFLTVMTASESAYIFNKNRTRGPERTSSYYKEVSLIYVRALTQPMNVESDYPRSYRNHYQS